jgi:Tfp pilus assembly protein PilX
MKKMNVIPARESGSTLMVVIAVTASILALLGVAVEYTSQISRVSERSRQSAVAMEIADGHLEMLFTQWRNIYRTTWSTQYGSYVGATDTSMCPTNYFYTTRYSPAPAPSPLLYMSPAATPPVIPTPAPSHFSTSNYTLGQ